MSFKAVLSKPSALLVIALVVAGVGVKFLPEIKLPDWSSDVARQTNKPSDTLEQSQPVPHAPEVLDASTGAASPTTSVPNPTSQPDEAPVTPLPASVASSELPVLKVSAPAPVVVAAAQGVAAREPVAAASKPLAVVSRPLPVASQAMSSASKPSSAPALPTTGMVVFKAKGPTWVKVVDAKGIVQLSKMLASGDVVGASGTAPLAVVIGRVDLTDVEVHGKAFPLTATSKDNVARFEVK